MQPVAANAACSNFAIWTEDGSNGEIKKWSTDGTLLSTIQTTTTAPDIAVSSDLSQILAFNLADLEAFNVTTGALESTNPITGSSSFINGGAGAGVVSGGKLLTDAEGPGLSEVIVSVDLTTYVGTDLASLDDAESSVPVGVRGGAWGVAGDILQLPDNDILVVAQNDTVYADGVVLLRINKNTPTQVTAVGVVASSDSVWGAARAGDDIFLATEGGSILKLGATIPTAASLDPIATTEIVTGGGSFWGAAGSDDSTDGNAVCQEALADTGLDMTAAGIIAFSVIAAGVIALLIRRREAQG